MNVLAELGDVQNESFPVCLVTELKILLEETEVKKTLQGRML